METEQTVPSSMTEGISAAGRLGTWRPGYEAGDIACFLLLCSWASTCTRLCETDRKETRNLWTDLYAGA